ncbi:hypothetical protein PVAP13_9KG040000 [Panicum virgatum]|uniref:Uncharacterized protein n=1 Tax=Panicum virgatum TaxID=38727 RepID=A0A8T0NEV4_PANVG|nr:hypothetical protein PVAP13_9KG040000 [Panicum virgatum]
MDRSRFMEILGDWARRQPNRALWAGPTQHLLSATSGPKRSAAAPIVVYSKFLRFVPPRKLQFREENRRA